jgi:Tfp pilus assembly protein PilF
LEKVGAVVQAEPKNISAYIIRGHIYSEMKLWEQADNDYRTILQIDPDNFSAQFNVSELKLMQKDYDGARPGFVALEENPDWGDLAAYKVFVCDLFGGHENAAQSELDAFDQAESKASYYYSNATWEFYHKRPESALTWLNACADIYPSKTAFFYSATLVNFGYIPSIQQANQAH